MNIKKGDLVMVVKPTTCCGHSLFLGQVFNIASIETGNSRCSLCGHSGLKTVAFFDDGRGTDVPRLKKIDPPSEGDSLPTRKELEVTA